MKLVIDIPNYDYEYITNGCIVPIKFDNHIYEAIRSGTPLPKGHGDLIDRNDYDKRLESIWKFYHGDETIHDTVDDFDLRFADGVSRAREALNDAPTIIEADGGGE